MARPGAFYRGESRPVWILTLVVSILAAMILFAVWLFYHMQQYMVYDKDGARLVPPSERAEIGADVDDRPGTAAVIQPLIDVEIVIDRTDWSGAAGVDTTGLRDIHARYVAAPRVTAAELDAWAADMGGYDALVLQLKTADGLLSYQSGLTLTDSYAVNGEADIREGVAKLKAKGVYLVAELSALEDSMMATRNSPAAMKHAASGGVYTDGGQSWLDPYSEVTRGYLAGLMEELARMGFDEILLSGLYLPDSEDLRYGAAMTAQPDPADAVAAFAFSLREKADALGVRLSAVAGDTGAGQEYALFFKAFDRVAYENGSSVAALEAALGVGDDTRIVPITATAPERGSYIVK